MNPMVEFVEYLVKSLVDRPDSVAVNEVDKEDGTHLEVHVDPRDAGMVIGRRGYVIRAIRMLTGVMARQAQRRVLVDIVPLQSQPTAADTD